MPVIAVLLNTLFITPEYYVQYSGIRYPYTTTTISNTLVDYQD
jgi:hypothetical protein